MTEQVDNRHDPQARRGCRVHQAGELPDGVGAGPGDAGQARVLDGVFKMEVQLLVTPLGIAREPRQQEIQPLHLPGKVPLESADWKRWVSGPVVHGTGLGWFIPFLPLCLCVFVVYWIRV